MPVPTLPVPAPDPTAQPPRRDNVLRGIGLMVAATVFLSSADAATKYLTIGMSSTQVGWLRYVSFFLCMLPFALAHRGKGFRTGRLRLQMGRGAMAGISSLLFIMGLAQLPMADTTATAFISPLLVTALSIPLLGERVGWRRWLATSIGLLGVLVIVRPGGAGFQSASLLPAVSAFAWAFVLIFTRMMRDTESAVTTLTYTALVGSLVLSVMLPFAWQPLTTEAILFGFFIGVTSTIGHWLVITAFRYGDVSVLAPFSYVQLIGATVLGYTVFDSLPDTLTFVGAGIIIGSSLYTAHRERVRSQEAARAAR